MKIAVIVLMLICTVTMCACAQDDGGRYRFYSIKSGNNDLAILVDSATGKTWQVFVDSTGKMTHLVAITVEGVAYAPKDIEELYSKVQSVNIEGLSTSNSAIKVELDKLYGYGLDGEKLIEIRDKVRTAVIRK